MDSHQTELDQKCINTIRTLSMDAIEKANSGHPGTPMALAPLAYVLWTRFLRFNPKNPNWFDRDRFVLSCGHASMLLYAMLYLTGYDLSLDDIKNFRQWGSKTPGHPEHGLTPGVETTTGPLGQGIMNAVGMAMAEAHLAAAFNRGVHDLVNHHTYAFCSDGDFMEGASHEAASLAGHLGLGKLICFYDDNHITIEGETGLSYSDDVAGRFKSYRWQVIELGEKVEDLDAVVDAISEARLETSKPSLIIARTHIAYGSPNKQDTADAHGAPLGPEEIKLTKRFYGWPEDESFLVPDAVLQHMRRSVERGDSLEESWSKKLSAYGEAHPDRAREFEKALNGELPQGWDSEIPEFKPEDGPVATRAASGKVLNAFAHQLPQLLGGSADLAPSTKTLIKGFEYFSRRNPTERNFAWGIREHAMCSCSSGMALHGGIRPYAATFLIFTDYARPAIRLAALMKLPVIYVMTHDSIGVGEDGPTHQPIEQLASLRAIPGLFVIRPCDANETACAWRVAVERKDGPTLLALSRQKLPILDRKDLGDASGLRRGAYILSPEKGSEPQAILLATGSEVPLALEAQEVLASRDLDVRVVSMPCWELFQLQDASYREQVIPSSVKARLAVEAGSTMGWAAWVGDAGDVLGIDRFGASAPGKEVFRNYGFTVENVVEKVTRLVGN